MKVSEKIIDYVCKCGQFENVNQSKNKEIDIGFGVNTDFIRPMATTIISTAVNNPDLFINFYVLTNSFLSQSDLSRLQSTCSSFKNISLHIYKVDENIISHLPTLTQFPLAIYFRLIMPLLLKDKGKILYLDSDVVCLNGLSELINLNIENHIVAAISDNEEIAADQAKKLGIQRNTYFNSGVMLINIQKWLQENITEKVLSVLVDKGKNFSLPDQDALNLVLENRIFNLHNKWNFILAKEQNVDIPFNTAILHFAGNPKPWRLAYSGKEQDYYMKYEKLSPWNRDPLELPSNYREARIYCKKLFDNGEVIRFLIWFFKYLIMRRKEKSQNI